MPHKTDPSALSDIHFDVLNLLVKRKTSKEIALELDIAPSTVEQRIRKAREVLRADNRRELVAAWIKVKDGFTQKTYDPQSLHDAEDERLEEPHEAGTLQTDTPPLPHSGDSGVSSEPTGFVSRFVSGKRSPLATVGMIVLLAVLIMMLLLVGLGVSSALSDLTQQRTSGS